MSVRKNISEYNGIYFITLTCCRWLNLFDIAQAYDAVYKWFDYLKSKGHFILAYVIMPNHLHVLIAFRNTEGKSINAIIGNGKRFMAYEIIAKLKLKNEEALLKQLSGFVNVTEKRRGKLHEVFEPSFDWKECLTDKFVEQKLEYIHNNPCSGKWNLCPHPWDYPHSSAKYYIAHEQGVYPVTSYAEIEDIDLTKL